MQNFFGHIIDDRFIIHETLNTQEKTWVGTALDTFDNEFVIAKYIPSYLKMFTNNELNVQKAVKGLKGFPKMKYTCKQWKGKVIIYQMYGLCL